MRKLKKGRKFGRVKKQREALFRSLSVGLVEHGKIKTTLPKAKELRVYVERLITYAKNDPKSVSGIRRIETYLPKKSAIKIVKEIAPKYSERKGGYTRILKLQPRVRDAAKMAYIEFV